MKQLENCKMIGVRLPYSVVDKLKIQAEKENRTVSAVLRDLICGQLVVEKPFTKKVVCCPVSPHKPLKKLVDQEILELHDRHYSANQIAAITRQPYSVVARVLSDGIL